MSMTDRITTLLVALSLAVTLAAAAADRQSPPAEKVQGLPADSTQLLLVITADWNATTGTLQRLDRLAAPAAWAAVGARVPVVVGRSGLAWGRGSLIAADGGPAKKEGDGKSPAGAFRLGTVFGQTAQPPSPLAMPYLFLDQDIECVDDSASSHYNEVMNRARAQPPDWKSSEKMWQEPLYKLGVVVNYNQPPAARGAGSCIFLHIWKGPGSTTAGCTAMSEQHLVEIVKWLDASRKPLLVQLPRQELEKVKERFRLPNGRPDP